jgi:hypothetical protein
MPKLFLLLFLIALTAGSEYIFPLKVSHASEPRLQTLTSLQLNQNFLTQQSLIAANIPDEKPLVEIYQGGDKFLLAEPGFMEPTEPETMEPAEPEFMKPVDPTASE